MVGDMTAHFSRREFTCKCGCAGNEINAELVNKLESVYDYLSKTPDGVAAVYITSGYRCPKHSVNVGGGYSDAHTRGIAADFYAVKADGSTRWNAYELAAICEKLGFSGIGIIQDGAMSCIHADIRNNTNYVNSHWFGNEITGDNNVKSFLQYLPAQKSTETKHKLTVIFDGKTIFEKEC